MEIRRVLAFILSVTLLSSVITGFPAWAQESTAGSAAMAESYAVVRRPSSTGSITGNPEGVELLSYDDR